MADNGKKEYPISGLEEDVAEIRFSQEPESWLNIYVSGVKPKYEI